MRRLHEQSFALAALLFALLAPLTAFAGETVASQQWWETLLAHLLEAFVLIAVPVLSTLVIQLLKRWNIKLQYETVVDIAQKGAGWAEQIALKRLKDGAQTPSAQKLDDALKFGRGIAEQQKLSKKAIEKLQELIEASLGGEKLKEPSEVLIVSEKSDTVVVDEQ